MNLDGGVCYLSTALVTEQFESSLAEGWIEKTL